MNHSAMPTAPIDTAPSVPLDLDAMARIAEDAARAATEDAHPVAGAPLHARTVARWRPLDAAGRLWRAAYRSALPQPSGEE